MTRSWSPARVLAAVALAMWAVLFWVLLLTGRTSLYLSSRTAWVVPVGAVVLSLAALGRLLTARTTSPEPVSNRATWATAFVLIPAVAILALPPTALGSYAASRRSLAQGFAGSTELDTGGQVTLASVAAAGWSDEARRALVERAGSRVSFVGRVTRREGQSPDEFTLTRFIVSCCVADALSVQARVVGVTPGRFSENDWVRVEGTFYPVGREVIVDASRITAIPQPADPYLDV